MIKRFKTWLVEKYLPACARLELQDQLQRSTRELAAAQQEIRVLRSYINGLHRALRSQRVIINVSDGKEAVADEHYDQGIV